MMRRFFRASRFLFHAVVLVTALGLAACSDDGDVAVDQHVAADAGPADVSLADAADASAAADAGVPDSTSSGSFSKATEAKLQKVLQDGWKAQGPPGGTMAARMGQSKLWAGAVGLSDLSQKSAMKPGDRLRIASITKVFMATLVLLLEQEKLLSVEDKLSKWLPNFPKGDGIALYQLMNHTSGVYNYTDSAQLQKKKAATLQQLAQIAVDHGPSFSPGTKWGYSNTNYILLAQVVEKAAKTSWHVALRKRVLDKNGLKDTFVAGFEAVTGGMVKGYGLAGGKTLEDVTAEIHPSVVGPAGCMVSTVADLTRFFNLLQGGSILSAASLKKMQSTYKYKIDTSNSYGLGILISESGGQTFYCHNGSIDGFSSITCYWDSVGASVSVLFNATEAKAGAFISEAFKALL